MGLTSHKGADGRCSIKLPCTFLVETQGIDEGLVALTLRQKVAVDILHIHVPNPEQAVKATRHHQVLCRGVELGTVEEAGVGQDLLSHALKPLDIPQPETETGDWLRTLLIGSPKAHGIVTP